MFIRTENGRELHGITTDHSIQIVESKGDATDQLQLLLGRVYALEGVTITNPHTDEDLMLCINYIQERLNGVVDTGDGQIIDLCGWWMNKYFREADV